MVEYLEDAIEIDPAEEFPRPVRESGTYGYRTGDAVVDKWQEDAALGKPVDVDAAFTDPETRQQFEKIREASRARHRARTGAAAPADDEIHEDYAGR